MRPRLVGGSVGGGACRLVPIDLGDGGLRQEPASGLPAALHGVVDAREDPLVDGDEDAFGWHAREYIGIYGDATDAS